MKNTHLDKVAINVYSRKILHTILEENPVLERILRKSTTEKEAARSVRDWIQPMLKRNPAAESFYFSVEHNHELFQELDSRDFAVIRLLDYIENSGKSFDDQNLQDEPAETDPVKMLWLATNKGIGGAKPDFFIDMLFLFRQLNGKLSSEIPHREQIEEWMERYPSGLESKIVELRKENRNRIIRVLIKKLTAEN